MRLPASIPGLRWAAAVLDAASRATLRGSGAGLVVHRTASGTSVSDPDEPTFFAKLVSGSGGGPYAFRRVAWVDGVWVERVSGDDPATAYEANLIHPGVPRIVRLIPSGLPGEYRFVRPRGGGEGGESGCFPCEIPRNDLTLTWRTVLEDLTQEVHDVPLAYRDNCLTVSVSDPHHYLFDYFDGTFAPYWRSDVWTYPGAGTVRSFEAEGGPPPPYYYRFFLVCGSDGGHGTADLPGSMTLITVFWTDEADADAALVDNALSCDVLTIDADAPGVDPGHPFHYIPFLGSGFLGSAAYFAVCCSPFRIVFQGSGVVVYDTSPAAPTSQEICVTVRGLGCPGEDGPPVSGATVLVAGDLEAQTCTTDAAGRCCVTVSHGGEYTVEATLGDCNDVATLETFVCDASIEASVTLCCVRRCFAMVDDETDEPLAGAILQFPGLSGVAADEDGIVCVTLPVDYLSALPVPGVDCSVRTASGIIATASVGDPVVPYLYRCLDPITVTCGDTGDPPTEVRMAKIPLGWRVDAAGTCCPPLDCSQIGPNSRALWPEVVVMDVAVQEYYGFGLNYTRTFNDVELALDNVLFDSTGRRVYVSGCLEMADVVYYCDFLEVEISWTKATITLETCRTESRPALLTVVFHLDPGCNHEPYGFQDCRSCDFNADIKIEIEMDVDAAEGAQTRRLCWGESMQIVGGETGPGIGGGEGCYYVVSASAVGKVAA